MDRLSRLLTTMLFVIGLSASGSVYADDCDPLLLSDSSNPLSYRQRQACCEGLYIQQVASTPIILASLTAAFDDYDVSQVNALFVSWSSSTFDSSKIHVRGKGIRWRLHYRMDAVRPISQQQFRWPSGVLDALNIGRQDLGLLGWVTVTLADSEKDVYLPLSISTELGVPRNSGSYQLVVIPGVPFEEVFLSIAFADSAGNPKGFIIDSEPLGYGYYPPYRAVRIPLKGFTAAGLYYVELGARLRDGGASTLTILVQHDAT